MGAKDELKVNHLFVLLCLWRKRMPEELGGDVAAADVSYINTQAGLTAEDVQID